MSIRDLIADADDLRHFDIEVPEWDVTLRFMEMTVDRRIRFTNAQNAAAGDDLATSRVFAHYLIESAVDPETNEPVFTPADEAMLRGKNGRVVNELVLRILELNAMHEGAVEEAGKASSTTNTSGDGSDSPPDSE